MALVRKVVAEIVAGNPGADASWDGRFTAWESQLADLQRRFEEFPEVMDEIRNGRTAIAAQRGKTDAFRKEAGRVDSLAALGNAATGPDALASALEAFRRAHPDAPESSEFEIALAAKPAWEAVMAWSALRTPPSAALAERPQADRDAAISVIDAHIAAFPGSPYGSACRALRPLLSPAPDWRRWLSDKLSTLEPMALWFIERKDGSRWYCKSDPRRVPMQNQAGGQWKSVLVLQGASMKEAFERFDQGQVKAEGPSPQMAFAARLAALLADEASAANDIDAAFDAMSALRGDESVDGVFAGLLMRGLLESAASELPDCVRPEIEAAARRIAKEKLEQVDWLNPRDPDARARGRAVRALLREVVQVELWRRTYQSAVASACGALATAFEPAGVVVGPAGSRSFLGSGGRLPTAGTVLWVAEPPIGDKTAAMVRLGVVGESGSVAFEAAANSVPSGTLVFAARRGVLK
jgi:hypothetical protein